MQDLEDIESYYSQKIIEHGASPQGVDWNGEQSQNIRFEQLLKVIDSRVFFSLNDFGCGYGALYDYMKNQDFNFDYLGNDISTEMIQEAKKRIANKNVKLSVLSQPLGVADYTIASGIFNVALNAQKDVWKEYIFQQLKVLNEFSSKGFSFNCLTSYSEESKKKGYLYYAEPCEMFNYCKKHFSKNVALLHDYNLYEFTILVRKI